MKVSYYIKDLELLDGQTPLFLRLRDPNQPEIKQKIKGITVNAIEWNEAHGKGKKGKEGNESKRPSETKLKNYFRRNRLLKDQLDEIADKLEAMAPPVCKEQIAAIVDGVVFKEQREKERIEAEARQRAEEEARRRAERESHLTFTKYFKAFVDKLNAEKEAGIPEEKRTRSERTRINYAQGLRWLESYEQKNGRPVEFDDVDMTFFQAYNTHLSEHYSVNTISKRFAELKSLMHEAAKAGLTTNPIWANPDFGLKEEDADSIALTRAELDAMKAVDLSDLAPGYQIAMDLFVVGVGTAQRVSDYNNIKKDDIHEEDGILFISIKQKKTDERLEIPVNHEVREILEKYDYNLPHLSAPLINAHIKEIAKRAGLTRKMSNMTMRIGKAKGKKSPALWELITTHTARRTGATLKYLAGYSAEEVRAFTGHSTDEMLKKYVKADTLDKAKRLASKHAEDFR